MSTLTIFEDTAPGQAVVQTSDPAQIAALLKPFNVRFERWEGPEIPPRDADEATVLTAYRPFLDRLMGETGAGSADVLRVNAQTPNYGALRKKFLSEHTHSEDEVRFFVHGSGHFVLHIDDRIYDVECCQSDLISVPEGYKHWFDGGPAPDFVTLRIFTHKEGWIADYTDTDLAQRFLVYPQ
ncbi:MULTISPECIES: 1,2-dihydroxy-3-keto-5-methylthiopentene dioxygenase [Acetobacter]|uniref:1,2-dihydroxy-3-keto-5-methylthiopentene dioxygenase n=1 Tax=Acetobacter TaxID=434 RepID=UPI000A37D4EB|nr:MULTISPECIES: acireductone dioxygenase [Acetobacter]MBS0979249.1 acireductone dioxygenase [Acetobacter thailandicus]MBS0985745.1 acireductone dioxygenase [Acetobacter thailandicus]MBS1002367.1 acireductone dioxygenase [Acetobacter thailandicus]OUI88989.1 acireductone dioxygenase [Acetobacter sp. DmW_043]OUJ09643.1 acireductone dioxygenase [Acetobacter sp. DsW_059]